MANQRLRWLLVVGLSAGCLSTAERARLDAVDAAIARGDVAAGVAAYEQAGVPDEARLRALARGAVWRSLAAADVAERTRAVEIAAALADAPLDRALAERLDDAVPSVRALAAVALARDNPQVRALVAALLDGQDAAARAIAIDGLGALGDGAERLGRLATDGDARVRSRAARALAELRPENARALLVALTADGDAGVRADALRAIGALGDRAALPVVERGLADPALGARLAALSAIARLAPERLCAPPADPFMMLRAAVALARLGHDDDAAAAIRAGAAHPRPDVRVAAMNAAGELGAAGADVAATLLRDRDLEVRLAAARALCHAGRPAAALPVLAAALATPLALDAADELARAGDDRGARALTAAAQGGDAGTRRAAIALLAPLPSATAALTHALGDGDARVRLTAAAALLRRTLVAAR
jgi:HEAT repeat protein